MKYLLLGLISICVLGNVLANNSLSQISISKATSDKYFNCNSSQDNTKKVSKDMKEIGDGIYVGKNGSYFCNNSIKISSRKLYKLTNITLGKGFELYSDGVYLYYKSNSWGGSGGTNETITRTKKDLKTFSCINNKLDNYIYCKDKNGLYIVDQISWYSHNSSGRSTNLALISSLQEPKEFDDIDNILFTGNIITYHGGSVINGSFFPAGEVVNQLDICPLGNDNNFVSVCYKGSLYRLADKDTMKPIEIRPTGGSKTNYGYRWLKIVDNIYQFTGFGGDITLPFFRDKNWLYDQNFNIVTGINIQYFSYKNNIISYKDKVLKSEWNSEQQIFELVTVSGADAKTLK